MDEFQLYKGELKVSKYLMIETFTSKQIRYADIIKTRWKIHLICPHLVYSFKV